MTLNLRLFRRRSTTLKRTAKRNSTFAATLFAATICAASFLTSFATLADEPAADPPRLRRADSFLGVHFDFHAGKTDQNVGANTTPETVQAIVDAVRPDYIQIDCKGHPGITSYPTKVGTPAPGIVADGLKVWRETTAKNGVALYMHYSGVWDAEAVATRPDWAKVDPAGKRSDRITSVFGGYKDGLLSPQLLELANVYGVDGAWVDGECWATEPDYSDRAKSLFREKTGRETIPTAPDQDGWTEWREFHREGFRQYLRDYIAAVKRDAPNFQIASNWAFTDHMPEPISVPVDFLSGDYSPNDSVSSARYSSRFLAEQGKSWDLMAWSFANKPGVPGWTPKTGVQLCREAACVLAQGGGFQAYITQERDGSVNLAKLPPMAEAARFCRERQALSHRSTAVPQIALFCPTATHYRQVDAGAGQLFPMITWQRPILKRLLEANYSVQILADKALSERIAEFPLVVFYRGADWSPELKSALVEYVRGGGNVLAIGNEPREALNDVLEGLERKELANNDDVWFLWEYELGAGKIVVYPTPVGSPQEFVDASGPTFNAFLNQATSTLFANPIVRFSEPRPLDVSVRRAPDGSLTIHLVNVSGPHESAGIIDEIAPVENVETTIRLEKRPAALRLEPSGVALDFTWENGVAKTTIPSVPIHEIVVVEELNETANDAEKPGYAIVATPSVLDDADWAKVVDSLKTKRGKEFDVTVIRWDESAFDKLRDVFPRYAAFVVKPQEATAQRLKTIWQKTRELDSDPFGDVVWGIITGYDAADALRLTQTTDMKVERVCAGTSVALSYFKSGVCFDELKQNFYQIKEEGKAPESRNDGPNDTTKAIADALDGAQLFVTSGHATQRDWQLGFRYKNGYFVSGLGGGALHGKPSDGDAFEIKAGGSKIHLASGNCLIGDVDGLDAMALALIRNANVDMLIGYVVPTWFGYMGWGVQDYYIEQPGRFTAAEAFFANNQALLHLLEEAKKKNPNAEQSRRRTLTYEDGLLYDRDVVALYGDPAWRNALAEQESGWKQELTSEKQADGRTLWTLTITPLRGSKSFDLIDGNGSRRGGRPFFQFFPRRVADPQVVVGQDVKPIVVDDFILIPQSEKTKSGAPFVVQISTK